MALWKTLLSTLRKRAAFSVSDFLFPPACIGCSAVREFPFCSNCLSVIRHEVAEEVRSHHILFAKSAAAIRLLGAMKRGNAPLTWMVDEVIAFAKEANIAPPRVVISYADPFHAQEEEALFTIAAEIASRYGARLYIPRDKRREGLFDHRPTLLEMVWARGEMIWVIPLLADAEWVDKMERALSLLHAKAVHLALFEV